MPQPGTYLPSHGAPPALRPSQPLAPLALLALPTVSSAATGPLALSGSLEALPRHLQPTAGKHQPATPLPLLRLTRHSQTYVNALQQLGQAQELLILILSAPTNLHLVPFAHLGFTTIRTRGNEALVFPSLSSYSFSSPRPRHPWPLSPAIFCAPKLLELLWKLVRRLPHHQPRRYASTSSAPSNEKKSNLKCSYSAVANCSPQLLTYSPAHDGFPQPLHKRPVHQEGVQLGSRRCRA